MTVIKLKSIMKDTNNYKATEIYFKDTDCIFTRF